MRQDSLFATNRFARPAVPPNCLESPATPRPKLTVLTAYNRSHHPPRECWAPPPSRVSRDCQPQSNRSFWFFCRTVVKEVDDFSCRRTQVSGSDASCALMRFSEPSGISPAIRSVFRLSGLTGPHAERTGSPVTGRHGSQHVGRIQGVVHGRADSADPGGSTSRPASQSSNRRRTQLSRPVAPLALSRVRV